MITEQEIIDALSKVNQVYGNKMARRIEQLFRNETAHFKSRQFLEDLSAGMEAFGDSLPFGWGRLLPFWSAHPEYAPTGITQMVEHTSALANSRGSRRFLKFATLEASMFSVCEDIKILGGDFGAWFSNQPKYEAQYDKILDTIVPRYCNSLDI
jgi:hypothetical protein